MTVEALNCPNCGAGVASDSSQCQFCKTRLKTMACPSCFGLMFVGAKFCDHCGAIAAPIEVSLYDNAGDCPRCRQPLETLNIESTTLRACKKCDGLWMEADTFEQICADREQRSAVMSYFADRTLRGNAMTKVNYVPCPECGELMNRNNFARASGVIVDICKQHGVWFDSDELPSVIGFIEEGGMEIARQREMNEIKDERDRLRNERMGLGSSDEKLGIGGMFEIEENSAIRSFVKGLFD
jgi:Zn-finger nucleic acid-binding protein